eukprot:2432249-Alexandrium_andersonii.AAC.1
MPLEGKGMARVQGGSTRITRAWTAGRRSLAPPALRSRLVKSVSAFEVVLNVEIALLAPRALGPSL